MFKSALIYLFGGVFNKAIPFLLLPVLTRYLSPEDYGTVVMFQVLLAFTIPLVGMNMQNNISRNFTKFENGELARLIGILAGLLSVSMGIVSLIVAAWVALSGSAFGIPGGWLLILPLVAALSMAHQFNLTVLRNQDRPFMFGAFEISNTLLNVAVSLALVVGLGLGWQGRAAGVVCTAVCFGIVGLIALRRQNLLVFDFDRGVFAEVLRISLPLIPHALGGIIISMSDRIFVERMVSKEAVGLYAVGCTFGMIVNLFVEAFNRAWAPWFYRQMSDATSQTRKRIVRYTYICFAGVFILAIMVTFASHLIMPYLVSEEFQSASQFVLWIAVGYAFRGMYTMIFPYLVFAGKTNFLGISTIFMAIACLVFNYLLIRLNGPVGAAQASILSWLVLFLCTWVYSMQVCKMPWFKLKKG